MQAKIDFVCSFTRFIVACLFEHFSFTCTKWSKNSYYIESKVLVFPQWARNASSAK